MILLLLVALLEFAIPFGILVFCLVSLFSAFKADRAKRTAEAIGLSLPFALLVVSIVWFRA